MKGTRITLEPVAGHYAVCRFDAGAAVPDWAEAALRSRTILIAITRTDRELSIVADDSIMPADVCAERGFVAMRVAGTLDFGLIGILARLTSALAEAHISVFAISTFETDYLLVKERDRDRALEALRNYV